MKKKQILYSSVTIFVLWLALALLDRRGIIPPPGNVIFYMSTHWARLMQHLSMSFFRICIAIFATMICGTAVGILSARHTKADVIITPLLYAFYPVPKIAFLPLLMLFFGLGNTSKILLVGLILFFQIAIAVRDGVKHIPEGYFLTVRPFHPNTLQLYRHVILPALLPQLFTALRVSVGTSISVLFFAENFATQYGIGYFIMDSWLKLDYSAMFAGIIAISFMGAFIFLLIDLSEKHFCRWRLL
ncbi:MAG: NitT/TauT family transport system permease protein [Clostridiales bacterium]|jgi:NitT/TauT family transport system permease protein|nr:NitT/TauT family transport system permease protein [Clostridiales bacterium]MDN5297879.1 NitT/TauT family transport system permease protein [Clostridiales bacterium]